MTKEQYLDFCLRYRGCGACFPLYEKLSKFEKMWFTAVQKDVADLEKENAELKAESDFYNKERGNYKALFLKATLKNRKAKDLLKLERNCTTF